MIKPNLRNSFVVTLKDAIKPQPNRDELRVFHGDRIIGHVGSFITRDEKLRATVLNPAEVLVKVKKGQTLTFEKGAFHLVEA